jgi:hypothetical protein
MGYSTSGPRFLSKAFGSESARYLALIDPRDEIPLAPPEHFYFIKASLCRPIIFRILTVFVKSLYLFYTKFSDSYNIHII